MQRKKSVPLPPILRIIDYFMVIILTIIFALTALTLQAQTPDTILLEEVEVVPMIRENGRMRQQPSAVTLIGHKEMEAAHVTSLKGASALVPNLFIPDYGSRLTSAIYIRGIGSRINTPAVGMYVDDIPYTDKSAFDFNFYDIERIDVLRGPQGTIYGRNTMGGLVKVYTRNPFFYTGTDVKLGFATGDSHHSASLTHYHRISDAFAFSAGGYYEGSNGFFRNNLTGRKADKMKSGGGRMRAIWLPSDAWKVDATLGYDYSDEGAYPYYYTGSVSGEEEYPQHIGQIANNRENRYRRGLLNAGVNVEYTADTWQMNAITGYQYIADRMFMDQDFLSDDIYTLEQRQRIHTLTEEITFKSRTTRRWQWISGINLMYQSLHTEGPVTFFADGLRWLERNINAVMPSVSSIEALQMMGFTGMSVNFRGDELLMDGRYDTPTLGAALFHQSTFRLTDALSVLAGIRFDYEKHKMDYYSPALVAYGFKMPNGANEKMAVDLQDLHSDILYSGTLSNGHFRLLPKLSLKYSLDAGNNLYAAFSMGQRSGGYNLQMFSDLLQGAMRVDMMEGIKTGVGNYLDYLSETVSTMPKKIPDPDHPGEYVALPAYVRRVMEVNMPKFEVPTTEQIVYDPEYSWNVEVGTHLTAQQHKFSLDAALFYTRIYDQQISRFAPSGLGRMMVNAGKSQSYGGELTLRWSPTQNLAFAGNYGYTHATFIDYDDGKGVDYTGNYVPFVPKYNLSLDASYTWFVGDDKLSLGFSNTSTGRIYWTESNSANQPFYTKFDARLAYETSRFTITLWGRNLTDRHYNTFYFESASRGYEQHAKPRQAGIDLTLHF